MNNSEYRIVELNGKFKIEKKFKKVIKTSFFFSKEIEVWKSITKYGGECFRKTLIRSNFYIDTYKDKMSEFDSLIEAEKVLQKLIDKPNPIYHYY